MPITQARMIRLINASTELLDNYSELLSLAKRSLENTDMTEALSQNNLKQIIGFYDGLVDTIRDLKPSQSVIEAIVEERTHFNIRRRANERSAQHIRHLRGKQKEVRYEPSETKPAVQENVEINLDDLSNRVTELWNNVKGFTETLNIHTVCDIIAEMGQRDQNEQINLVNKLIANGKLQTTHIGGEYTVNDETGGLLPDRPLGLRKKTDAE